MLMVGGAGWAGTLCIPVAHYTCDGIPIDNVLDCKNISGLKRAPQLDGKICFDETPSCDELVEAAKGVMPYLSSPRHQEWPNYDISIVHPVVRPYPSELELAEDEAKRKVDHVQWLKDKDAAISRFREAVRRGK